MKSEVGLRCPQELASSLQAVCPTNALPTLLVLDRRDVVYWVNKIVYSVGSTGLRHRETKISDVLNQISNEMQKDHSPSIPNESLDARLGELAIAQRMPGQIRRPKRILGRRDRSREINLPKPHSLSVRKCNFYSNVLPIL